MFDFLDDENTTEQTEVEAFPREYGIDFDTGQLTGEIVEGSEAVKVWAWLALHSPRYRHEIYSWQYGNEFDTLIGAKYSKEYTYSKAKKMVEDCLLVNKYIDEIQDFSCERQSENLVLRFAISTTLGKEEVEINV